MATTPASADHAASSKSVDSSLWWYPFEVLLSELENASPSSDLPPHLVKKLKDNHAWFLDTVSCFKPANEKSREALSSRQVKVGSHQLTVQPELKDTALQISSLLCLDEVQAYILVVRSTERSNLAIGFVARELLHMVMLQYYIERQCLLKCTRQIFMHALNVGTSKENCGVREEAQKLISDGLEGRLLSVFQNLLSSSYPENMDTDLFTLWAEEMLTEDNLVLDILFLVYYEPYCTCSGKQWKKLCLLYEGIVSGSYNFGKLAISTEALQFIYHAKVQLLLILIETLDLENLLQMIHDEMPFRQGSAAFSLSDIQEMDALVSSLSDFEMKDVGPLILAWGVFLCLISSLPGKQENDVLMDIDHVAYTSRAFEAASLGYFVEILQHDILKDLEGPVAGYRSVLRTFISAFIASYEISLQLEDNTLKLILDILCKIFQGEESLCIQFWDRDSFVDGPIRCLLCNLEGEFPFRTIELVHLLSALCEGTWPAECVYYFLHKSVGVSSFFEITNNSFVDEVSHTVETRLPLCIPGIEGLLVPSNTRGHVLKMVDQNRALVRWEYMPSGVLVLLLRLAQELYLGSSEEVLVTLDLFSRLVSFNKAACYGLMEIGNSCNIEDTGLVENFVSINAVEIICTLVKKFPPNCNGAKMMSMSVNILSKMLQCSPTHVASVALNTNIFDVALRMNPFNIHGDGLSSSSWLLSGRLANMLLIDCEHDSGCSLTLSVLDFTVQLVERGVENDVVLALVVFSLQYVLVNHEHWKYKVKHARWKVTLKVLEMMKKCILSISHHQKLHEVVRDILFCDSSIHGVLFRIVCITSQALEKLYVIRLYELMEIEGFELAISAAQDIIFCMLSDLSRDILPSLPVFQQAVLSSATKPIPVLTAMLSLISYFRSPTIQAGAAKVLSILFTLADSSQPYVFGNACFGLDEKQISYVRHSIISILSDQSPSNEDLFFATCKMLTSAANYQPAFFVAVIASKENKDVQLNVAHGVKQQNEATIGSLGYKEANLMDVILKFIDQPNDLINSNPRMLLNVLNFIKALWQESAQFTSTLDCLRNSGNFWSQLSKILQSDSNEANRSKNMSGKEVLDMACRCQCQCSVLQILAYETFLEKKLLHAELVIKEASEASKERTEKMDGIKRLSDASLGFTDAFSTFQKGLALENMIKSYASSDYDNGTYHCAKAAAGLLSVHMMGKLKSGNVGSFSVSLIEKIHILLKKMSELPAFSELVAQYTQRGYSDGKELHNLILSDLYYHLQGELEGRKIDAGPFKELYQFLLESNILQTYLRKYDGDLSSCSKSVYLFDSLRLRSDLGLDLWDYSEWKELKVVAETLLLRLEDVNSMMLLSSSKLSALKSLANILSMKDGNSSEKTVIEQNMPQQLILSCIDQVCRFLQVTVESLVPRPDAAQDILDFLAAQVDLLLHLVTYVHGNLSLSTCVLVINTSGSCLKVLSDFRPLISGVKDTTKLLLMLLLSSIKSSCKESQLGGTVGVECIEKSAEASNASLGLLPILCNCVELVDHCTLTLTIVDFILKGLLTPNTWFPIIQKHLQLQHLILKIKDKKSLSSIPVVLKFLLTIARVREGAEMLFTGGFLPSLRMLFADISECESLSIIESERGASNSSDKKERPHCIWGLGLAVVTAMVDSLRDSFSCADVVDYVITYFLEKASLVSYYLSAPEFPSDYHEKKRARAQKTLTSLSFLKGTENTVLLICKLAEHRNSWLKAMKEMDSHLRERSIHLLAFISRGTQYLRESSNKAEPILCHPTLREEYEWYKKPSFVKSKRGWFALSAVCCGVNPRFSVVSSKTSALVVRDREAETTDPASQTYFSDTIAIQVYRIALVLLRFLCLQAEGAVKRAEEVGFVDLAHFPELPMPEILHGLQDQGIAIVTELCEANQSKQVASQIQGVCILLLQITEMALYLEFCVSQICGIRPVLGHVEHFSRELKLLVKAMGGHAFLKGSVKSLKHILSYVYPGLLQTEGFFSSDM